MRHNQRHNRRDGRSAARYERRGVISIVLVLCLTTVLVALALALNAAWMVYHRNQIKAVCEASALAGVAQMFDQSPIGSGYCDCHSSTEAVKILTARQDAAGREQAMRFASLNVVDWRPVRLHANWDNDACGDVVTGWVDDPTELGCPMVRWQDCGPLNSMVVQTGLVKNKRWALSLWAASMFCMEPFETVVSARATVDQRVYGFRPAGRVRVPMLPLMLQTPGGDDFTETDDGEALSDSDEFHVDPRTGRVQRGRDGLVEYTFQIGKPRGDGDTDTSESAIGVAKVIHFGAVNSGYTLRQQVLLGLTADDLSPVGGAVTAFDSNVADVMWTNDATIADLASLRRSLTEIIGQKRIWAMGELGSSEIASFTAAHVVAVRHDGATGQLAIVLQPCVMHTPTALTVRGFERHPRIGKVSLTL